MTISYLINSSSIANKPAHKGGTNCAYNKALAETGEREGVLVG